MGDIGPERRRIEVLPTTEPVLPAPARWLVFFARGGGGLD